MLETFNKQPDILKERITPVKFDFDKVLNALIIRIEEELRFIDEEWKCIITITRTNVYNIYLKDSSIWDILSIQNAKISISEYFIKLGFSQIIYSDIEPSTNTPSKLIFIK